MTNRINCLWRHHKTLPRTDRTAAGNSTYKKLAVQWLNEALCFVSSFVVADSFRLRNRQLLVAAKRYKQPFGIQLTSIESSELKRQKTKFDKIHYNLNYMTLTYIKDKIVEQLSKLTIDDFYYDPQLSIAKQIFSEQTKLKTDEDFEQFLTEKFPETTAETLRNSLDQSIADFNEQIADIEKKIKTSQTKIDKLETQVAEKKEQQADIPKKQNKTKSELTDIETEIKQIKPLSGKPPYDKQIESLEKTKEEITKELESYPAAILKAKEELEELQNNIKTERETISQKESEIKSIHSQIENKQQELNQLREKESTHFNNEYSSLEFLFKILLHKEIRKVEIVRHKETGNRYPIDSSYFKENDDIEKTGEIILKIHHCGFDEVCNFILPFTNSKSLIPKDWRKIIYKTLSNPIPEIMGTISEIKRDNTTFFKTEDYGLSHIDISTLLAVKIAAKTKYSVRTSDNKIFLGLSG